MINFKGEFNSDKGNLYTVSIYNDAYTGAVIPLTITNVSINRGNSGIFDPVISSGCKVEFINNLLPAQLAGVFGNNEKTYLCEVTTPVTTIVDTTTVTIFRGWLAVDLIELGLEYQPIISLEFVDYLKKLDESESELISGDVQNVGNLLTDCLNKTVITQPIIINSSIHDQATDCSNINCYLKDNYIDTNNLLKNTEKDNCKDVIGKLLTPFNSYLYSWNSSYFVENYKDIDNSNARAWLKKTANNTYTVNAVESINLVEGVDFDSLTDGNLSYESGVKEYRLNLKQQLYNNLLYNNFSDYYAVSNNFPNITTGKWGVNLNGDLPERFTTGNGYFDIGTYYQYENQALWTHQNAHYRTIYNFNYYVAKKCKITLDKGNNPQNQLTVKAKVAKFKNIVYNANQIYSLGYIVKVQGGVNNGKFIGVNAQGKSTLYTPSTENRVYWYRTATGSYKDYQSTVDVTDTLDINNLVDVNDDGITTDSLFGGESDVTLVVFFTSYHLLNKAGDTTGTQNTQIVGGIEVKYTSSIQDNVLIGSIDGNFTKKLENSIYFFDTDNCNYSNSLFYFDGVDYQRTTGWKRDNITDSYQPLANKLIGDVFSFYAKTRKKISISIWTNKQVKPLSILTFANIDTKFFATKIQHDLGSDVYKIEAYELDYEEINI